MQLFGTIAYLVFLGGDIPAQCKAAGLSIHTNKHGCWLCLHEGEYIDNRYIYKPLDEGAMVPQYRSITNYQTSNVDHGQLKPSPFADLMFFHGPFMSPVDSMHLIGSNTSRQSSRSCKVNTMFKDIQTRYDAAPK